MHLDFWIHLLSNVDVIPAFSEGWTDTLLRCGESLARQPGETDDWCAFYVNMYVLFLLFTLPFLILLVASQIEICFLVLQELALVMKLSIAYELWAGPMSTHLRMTHSQWQMAKMKAVTSFMLAESHFPLTMGTILTHMVITQMTQMGKVRHIGHIHTHAEPSNRHKNGCKTHGFVSITQNRQKSSNSPTGAATWCRNKVDGLGSIADASTIHRDVHSIGNGTKMAAKLQKLSAYPMIR